MITPLAGSKQFLLVPQSLSHFYLRFFKRMFETRVVAEDNNLCYFSQLDTKPKTAYKNSVILAEWTFSDEN